MFGHMVLLFIIILGCIQNPIQLNVKEICFSEGIGLSIRMGFL